MQSVAKGYDGEIEVAYSGGKDSDVILQLAKESGIKYRAIYKMTTIDPPGTIQHVKDMGVEIRRPKQNFGQLIANSGFPNRNYRFCCEKLKEYKALDKSIIGVRREESNKRAERYAEPTACRYFGAKKPENHVEQIYPLLEWTTKDVSDFLSDRNIKCAPVYYDEEGNFHSERRLGCMCCPLASMKQRIESFKKFPNMVRLYLNRGGQFLETHKDSKIRQNYKDVYEWFVRDLFFDTQQEFEEHRDGFFGRPDYKAFLEDYFNIKL